MHSHFYAGARRVTGKHRIALRARQWGRPAR